MAPPIPGGDTAVVVVLVLLAVPVAFVVSAVVRWARGWRDD